MKKLKIKTQKIIRSDHKREEIILKDGTKLRPMDSETEKLKKETPEVTIVQNGMKTDGSGYNKPLSLGSGQDTTITIVPENQMDRFKNDIKAHKELTKPLAEAASKGNLMILSVSKDKPAKEFSSIEIGGEKVPVRHVTTDEISEHLNKDSVDKAVNMQKAISDSLTTNLEKLMKGGDLPGSAITANDSQKRIFP